MSGASTFTGAADFNGDIDVDGHTELDDLNVSGVSTFTGAIDANGSLDVDGHTELDDVNVSGVSTFTGAIDANGNLDVDGLTELDELNVSGIATINTLIATQSATLQHAGSTKFVTTGTGVSISSGTGSTVILAGPENFIIDPAGVGDNTGRVTIQGDLFVMGSETSISSQTIELADHRVGIATTVGTNLLLNGGGIGIGSANILKTIVWNNNSTSLKSSENWDLALGKTYKINGVDVLSSTTLGSGVTNSSLTGVGTLTGLGVTGNTTLENLNVTGIATIGTLGVTGLATALNLSVSGLSTFTGISTFSNNVFIAGTMTAGDIDGGTF